MVNGVKYFNMKRPEITEIYYDMRVTPEIMVEGILEANRRLLQSSPKKTKKLEQELIQVLSAYVDRIDDIDKTGIMTLGKNDRTIFDRLSSICGEYLKLK